MKTCAVLCTCRTSVYQTLEACDCYDSRRDARTFTGNLPVIAHPPCRLWGKLSHFAKPDDRHAEITLGIWCAKQVMKCGGILEHPVNSRLWAMAGLPRPGCSNPFGYTLDIDQGWFGHLAAKRTWLFISGVKLSDLPEIPFVLAHSGKRPVEFQSKAQRERTPEELAHWLVAVAGLVKKPQHTEVAA